MVHPSVADPAVQLEVGGQRVGIGPGGHAGARVAEVSDEDVDGGLGGDPVVLHLQQYVAVREAYGGKVCARDRLGRNDMPMDTIDHAILRELQADGRLPNATLAERVHLSPSPCLRRLKRLEQDGTITGYRAILDRRRVGLGLTVFVELKVSGHSQRIALEVERAVKEIDAIVACHIVAGMADFLLEVVVPDLAAYERLLLDTLLELPGVIDARSNIAIRTIKEAGPLPLP